jgi:hypothetical protein
MPRVGDLVSEPHQLADRRPLAFLRDLAHELMQQRMLGGCGLRRGRGGNSEGGEDGDTAQGGLRN